MNKAFEKIINRIDKEIPVYTGKAKQIVREVAEEYKDKPNIIDGLKIFLQEKFNYCAEQAEMNLEAECNSEIASYFRDRKELYLDRANIYGKVMREIDRIAQEYNNGWIPCSERLPEECVPVNVTWINRNPESYYAKIKDVPFSATAVYYNSKWYWYSSTCVDYLSEYGKNDFDLVDKDIDVVAWQPLPEPYKERE